MNLACDFSHRFKIGIVNVGLSHCTSERIVYFVFMFDYYILI